MTQHCDERDLPRLAGQAVQRALAARSRLVELQADEIHQVGGAAISVPLQLAAPALALKPIWAGYFPVFDRSPALAEVQLTAGAQVRF